MSSKPKSVTVKLSEPIRFGTEEITEFTLRRPKAKDVRGLGDLNKLAASEVLDLIGRLATQPRAVVDELEIEDLEKVAEALDDFLGRGRGTGAGD